MLSNIKSYISQLLLILSFEIRSEKTSLNAMCDNRENSRLNKE